MMRALDAALRLACIGAENLDVNRLANLTLYRRPILTPLSGEF
jgi:hypothetical protein